MLYEKLELAQMKIENTEVGRAGLITTVVVLSVSFFVLSLHREGKKKEYVQQIKIGSFHFFNLVFCFVFY